MSNNEQLFAEIIPTEEANLSGGNGGSGKFDNQAFSGADAHAYGGQFNLALTDTKAYTDKYSATASSYSVAATSGKI